jgi:outer membrane protein assembly factor BamB
VRRAHDGTAIHQHGNRFGRMRRIAPVIAIASLLLASVASADETDSGSRDVLTFRLLTADRLLAQKLSRAAEHLQSGRSAKAVELWQSAINQAPHAFVTLDDWRMGNADLEFAVHRPLAVALARALADHRPELISDWRRQYDGEARGALRTQNAAIDPETVRRFLLTTSGSTELDRLACLRLDRGDHVGASRLNLMYLRMNPRRTRVSVGTRKRLLVASARLADITTASEQLEILASLGLTPDKAIGIALAREIESASIRLQKASVSGPNQPAGLIERLASGSDTSPPPVRSTSWLATSGERPCGGAVDHSLAAARPSPDETAQLWKSTQWQPARRVVFADGALLIKSDERLECRDARSGVLRWRAADPGAYALNPLSLFSGSQQAGRKCRTPSEMQLFHDRLHQDMTVIDGSVYSLESDATLSGVPEFKPPLSHAAPRHIPRRTGASVLSAYEASTGRLRWQLHTRQFAEKEGPYHSGFLAAPVSDGESLFVPYTEHGELWLFALNPADGKLNWKRWLTSEPYGGCSPWDAVGMTVSESDLYVSTGAGRLFAFDAPTGMPLWAVTYPRTGRSTNWRGQNTITSPNLDGWRDNRLIPRGRQLIAVTPDCNLLFAIDRRDGDLLWQVPRRTDAKAAPADYVLGVTETRIIVAGGGIVRCHEVATGNAVWERVLEEPSYGRGCLASDGVYVPTGSGLIRLSIASGELSGQLALDSLVSPGRSPDGGENTAAASPSGNLQTDGKVLAILGPHSVTLVGTTASDTNDVAVATADGSADDAGRLISALSSASYLERERATCELLKAKHVAVDELTGIAAGDSAESRTRAFQVLLELTRSTDDRIARVTRVAVEQLARSPNRFIAERARRILNWPRDYAVAVLQSRGATFPGPGTLRLDKAKIDDSDMPLVARLTELHDITFNNQPITDVGLAHISKLTDLRSLSLINTRITNDGLKHISGLSALENLFLRETAVSDAGLKHLSGLGAMRQLRLQGLDVTDAGLQHLAGLTELRLLFLEGTQIGDAGLAHLRDLKELEHLYMHDTEVTNAGLVHMQEFPELFAVSLDRTAVTDEGLKHFIGLPRFNRLYLSGCNITDAGLAYLGRIPTMSDMNLQHTKITDAGLEYLKPLKRLARLGLPRDRLTVEAIADLKKALPRAGDVY